MFSDQELDLRKIYVANESEILGGQGMGNLIFKNPLKKFPDFSNRKGKPFTKCAAKRR